MVKLRKNSSDKQQRRSDYFVLERPLITEKSSVVGSQGNVVVFRVKKDATKSDIRSAVERIFNVEVKAVRTMNCLGKVRRTFRAVGRRSSFRKAYVTLKEGHSIDVVEGL